MRNVNHRAARGVPLIAGLGLLVAACHPGSNDADRRRDADALAQTLPVLASLRVEAFRDQDWCRNIAYRGGRFSTNPRRSTCNVFSGPPVRMPKTPPGEPGFLKIRDTLRRAQSRGGPDVRMVNVSYDSTGALTGAEFGLDCSWPFCGGPHVYVYAPDGSVPDPSSPDTRVLPAGPGWYLVREDG